MKHGKSEFPQIFIPLIRIHPIGPMTGAMAAIDNDCVHQSALPADHFILRLLRPFFAIRL